jgi:RimJ/RimL family protein N-acetyltransferase
MTTGVEPKGLSRTFPREVSLKGGKTFDLRLMTAADRDNIVALARGLSRQDLLFLRMDITDPRKVDEWVHNIESGRSITVLAYDGQKLAGYATLHHDDVLWTRHVGEIRTNVGGDYRGVGLGARLVEEMFQVAKDLGLKKITAHMTADQKAARATFERIGFRPEALLADHVVDAEGRTHDMLIMSYDVDGFHD